MYIAGENYRLTKHGRQRYLGRVGCATDSEMLLHAVRGDRRFRFIWKPDSVSGYRLVTVLLSLSDKI